MSYYILVNSVVQYRSHGLAECVVAGHVQLGLPGRLHRGGCVYIYIYMCMYIYIYICVYIIYIYIHKCVRVCMYECMYVCMCVYIYIYT